MRSDPFDRRHELVLRDGTNLSFTAIGPPTGPLPVIYCHGAIGTPVDATVDLRQIVDRLGVRYIAPSRPGSVARDPAARPDDPRLRRRCRGPWPIASGSATSRSSGCQPGTLRTGDRAPAQRPGRERIALCSALSPFCMPHRAPGLQRRIGLPLTALAVAPGLARELGDTVLPVLYNHPRLITSVIAAHAAPSRRARLASAPERAAALFDQLPRRDLWRRRRADRRLPDLRARLGFRSE